jgi:hypothetical protein
LDVIKYYRKSNDLHVEIDSNNRNDFEDANDFGVLFKLAVALLAAGDGSTGL